MINAPLNHSKYLALPICRRFESVPKKMVDSGRIDFLRSWPLQGPWIVGINGINNDLQDALNNYTYMNRISDHKVKTAWVYNKTYGVVTDLLNALPNTKAEELKINHEITKVIHEFHECNFEAPDLKLLITAHSAGNIHLGNAIKKLPFYLKQRIIVIQVAPGELISDDLCFGVIRLRAKNDPVPWIKVIYDQVIKASNYGLRDINLERLSQIKKDAYDFCDLPPLESHPDSDFIAHKFSDPVYEKALKMIFRDYIKKGGIYQSKKECISLIEKIKS